MKINSEQEMLNFGRKFAEGLTSTGGRSPLGTRIAEGNAWGTPTEHCDVGENARTGPVEARALVIELIGDVGTGKTTFTRGLAKGLGIKESVTSPSFTISKSYALPQGGHLIHYDFYRLNDPGLMSDDLQENLSNPNNIIVIEWGENITDILPDNRIIINITYSKDGSRNFKLNFCEHRELLRACSNEPRKDGRE